MNNASDAWKQAVRLERAREILKTGYSFDTDVNGITRVYKPEQGNSICTPAYEETGMTLPGVETIPEREAFSISFGKSEG